MMRNGAASAEKVAEMRMTGDTVVAGGSEIVFNNCGSHFIFKVSRGEWDYLFNEILNRQYFIKQILLMYYFCSSKDWPLALEKLRVELVELGENKVWKNMFAQYVQGAKGLWGVKTMPDGILSHNNGLESGNRSLKILSQHKRMTMEALFQWLKETLEFISAKDASRPWPNSPLELTTTTPDHIRNRIAECWGNAVRLFRLIGDKALIIVRQGGDGTTPKLLTQDECPSWQEDRTFFFPSILQPEHDCAGTCTGYQLSDCNCTSGELLALFREYERPESASTESLHEFIARRNSFIQLTCSTEAWGPWVHCTCPDYSMQQLCFHALCYLYCILGLVVPKDDRKVANAIKAANSADGEKVLLTKRGKRGATHTKLHHGKRSVPVHVGNSYGNGWGAQQLAQIRATGVTTIDTSRRFVNVHEMYSATVPTLKAHLKHLGCPGRKTKQLMVQEIQQYYAHHPVGPPTDAAPPVIQHPPAGHALLHTNEDPTPPAQQPTSPSQADLCSATVESLQMLTNNIPQLDLVFEEPLDYSILLKAAESAAGAGYGLQRPGWVCRACTSIHPPPLDKTPPPTQCSICKHARIPASVIAHCEDTCVWLLLSGNICFPESNCLNQDLSPAAGFSLFVQSCAQDGNTRDASDDAARLLMIAGAYAHGTRVRIVEMRYDELRGSWLLTEVAVAGVGARCVSRGRKQATILKSRNHFIATACVDGDNGGGDYNISRHEDTGLLSGWINYEGECLQLEDFGQYWKPDAMPNVSRHANEYMSLLYHQIMQPLAGGSDLVYRGNMCSIASLVYTMCSAGILPMCVAELGEHTPA